MAIDHRPSKGCFTDLLFYYRGRAIRGEPTREFLKVSFTVRKVYMFSAKRETKCPVFCEGTRGGLTERREGLSRYRGRDQGCRGRGGEMTLYRRGVGGREGSFRRGLDERLTRECSTMYIRSLGLGKVSKKLRLKGNIRSGKCKRFLFVLKCGLRRYKGRLVGMSHCFTSDGVYDMYKRGGGRLTLSSEVCIYRYKGEVSQSIGTTIGVHRRKGEVCGRYT